MSDHILVVDDDELVLSGLATNLAEHGFRVSTATNGAEAMGLVESAKPDLVLCDLVLGDINGIELMKRIRQSRPDTAVILITGHGSIRNALDALRNGASDYIQKPADPEEVIHRIRTVLHAVHLRRTLEAEREKVELRKRESSMQRMRHDRMAAVGLMAEGAAHALSNILRPVINYTPAIRDELPAGSAARELIAEVEEAGVKAESLLGDLHYIGAGTTLEKSPVDMPILLGDLANEPAIAALRENKPRLSVKIDIGESLAAVEGSTTMISRALSNLVQFASESVPSDGGVVSISSSMVRIDRPGGRYGPGKPGNFVVITIADNGPGLTVEDLDRIFEPFYTMRLGRTISGLALPLVYRVVADHGGSLDVTSAPGRGTTFVIHLPASGAPAGDAIDLRPDYSGGETILLVDDSEDHRTLASGLLVDQGYRVIPVADGHAALTKFEEALQEGSNDRIDLAVIDFVLADAFDGLETFKKIVEIRPRQKAIMASGFADLSRITEAKRLGIAHVIQKPYTQENLTRAVREALDA